MEECIIILKYAGHEMLAFLRKHILIRGIPSDVFSVPPNGYVHVASVPHLLRSRLGQVCHHHASLLEMQGNDLFCQIIAVQDLERVSVVED